MKKFFIIVLITAIAVISSEKESQINYRKLSGDKMELEFSVPEYSITEIDQDGSTFTTIESASKVFINKKGYAALPSYSFAVQLKNDKNVTLKYELGEYKEYDLDHPMLPAKGPIPRSVDPSTVKYETDPSSLTDTWYPAEPAFDTDPFILRDVRGSNVVFRPFVYNALKNKLRVYSSIKVTLTDNNTPPFNELIRRADSVDPEMSGVYRSLFVNYNESKALNIGDHGEILLVYTSNNGGLSSLQPWIDWKRQKGYKVNTLEVAAGTDLDASGTIQNAYNSNPNILYVQLVGDWADLKSGFEYYSITSSDGSKDPVLGHVAGSDNYQDVVVGRFSVQSSSDVTNQINKAINYEKNPETGGTWYEEGIGLASSEGAGSGDDGEGDEQHSETIKNYKVLPSTFNTYNTCYQANGAGNYEFSNYLNDGAAYINYTGHGYYQEWSNPNISNSNVFNLTNGNRLPYVISVACLVGHLSYSGGDCFAESWLKATSGGAAVGWFSTISQPWLPPMRGQDYFADILIGGYDYSSDPGSGTSTNEQRTTFGSITLNANHLMLAEAPTDNSTIGTIETWTIFGDASLQIRRDQPIPFTNSNTDITEGTYSTKVTTGGSPVEGAMVTIYRNGTNYTGVTDSNGDVSITHGFLSGDNVTLTVSGFNLDTGQSSITVGGGSTPPAAPVLAFPSNGSSTTDTTPAFDWNDVSGATSYTIVADNNSAFTSPEISQTVTASSYTASSALAPGTYYWKVKSNNSYGSSSYTSAWTLSVEEAQVYSLPFTENFNSSAVLPRDWSIADNEGSGQVWQFGTHSNGLSGADGNYAYLNSDGYGSGNSQNADLITPVIDMTGQSNVTLTFSHYFKEYSGSSASLYYSVNGGDTWTVISQWSSSTANPASFSQVISGVAGYSQVKFKWNYAGSWGYYWDVDDISITAQSAAPPSTPVLASPSNGSSTTDTTPSFDWNDVSDADSYTIQADNNSDFSSPEINESVTVSSYTPSVGLAAGTYYWRVNAANTNGTSSYSSAWTVTIETIQTYPIPFSESFDGSSIPSEWSQINTSGVTDRWTVSATTNAGGMANEMKFTLQQVNPGTARLVTPALETAGYSDLNLSFKHMLNDYGSGTTLKIQSSSDGVSWTDEAWSVSSGSGDIGPETVNTTVMNNLGSQTYVALVVTGDLYQINYWYIDDVSITNDTPLYPPTATTDPAGSIGTGSAKLNGTVNANGVSTTVSFEYGLTTAYGYTADAVPSTVTGSTDTQVYANISGLTDNTEYNYRIKAVNADGTDYGANMTFTTDQAVSSVDPPTDLFASVIGNDVSLSWTAPSGTGLDPDIMNDGFETYNDFSLDFSPWTQIDGDGSATYGSQDADFNNENYTGAYIVFNPSAATPELAGNWGANSGSKYAACFAAQTAPNDDWLISPQLLIGTSYNLNFYAKSLTDTYGLERFKVGVSTTGTNTGDFNIISPGSYVEAPTTWTNYNYDLSAYEGQEIYIAIICVSNDAFVFMVDDITVNNAKEQSVFAQTFEDERSRAFTQAKREKYNGTRSHSVLFSPAVTRSSKSTLSGYKVYRNSNLIATVYDPADVTYYDADLADGTYSYIVTALYSDTGDESGPSNTENVTISNEFVINSFPWYESFEKASFPPDEWTLNSVSANTWADTTGYTIGETAVNPVDGNKFAFVQWHGTDSQDEWLITPPIDLSSIDSPELKFWFSGSYYYSVDPSPNCMLKVMQSIDGGSWNEIWNASDHTGFNSSYTAYTWLETVLSLNAEGSIQLAFVYQGTDGANFAVDNISLNGTPRNIRNSVVDTGDGIEVHLTWGDVSGATMYHIYRSADPYGIFEKIGTTTSTYFVDDNITDDKMQFYYLTADNGVKKK